MPCRPMFGILVLSLALALPACAGPAPTTPPDRRPPLSAQRVIAGLGSGGRVRVAAVIYPIAPGDAGTQDALLLLYVGPDDASSIASAYLVAAPAGADMKALRAAWAARLAGKGPYALAQDRNVLLFVEVVGRDDNSAERAAVESALRAIP